MLLNPWDKCENSDLRAILMTGQLKNGPGQSGKSGKKIKTTMPDGSVTGADDDWALNLVDGANDLICLCRHGRIAYINAAGLVMLNLKSAKRAAGRHFAEFLHPEYRDIVAELLASGFSEDEPVPLKM